MPSEHGPSGAAHDASVTITVNGEPIGGADMAARFADAVREEQARGDGITIVYAPIAPPSPAKIDRLRKLWAMMRRAEVRLPKYGEM